MSCYFGLSFGNTNMCLAMHKDSQTDVLANAAGYRVTPSVIAFLDGTEKVVGLDAKQAMHKNAANTITNIKSLLFTDADDETSNTESNNQVKVNGKIPKIDLEKNGCISSRSVEDFLSILFTNMKEIACSHSHEDEYPTVVTVPLNFTEKHREIVKNALTSSGFQVLRIINEPSAAALAYNIGQDSNDTNSKCLVFRMGGTSLDVTVLQISNGMYSVLSSVQRNNFGGHLVTNCVVNFCASEFQRQYKVDVKENKRSLMKLRAAAEHYKHVVHGSINERCQVESLYDGIDLNLNISKARFDSLIQSTIHQCLEPVQEALSIASLKETDIDNVVLCGGSCKIPKLQQLLSQRFSSAKVLYSIVPDEVIAVGAAKEATLINSELKENDCFINLLSQDLSIKKGVKLKRVSHPEWMKILQFCLFAASWFSNTPEELLLCSKGTLIPTVITQSFTVSQNSNLKVEMCEGTPDSDTKPILAVLNMPNLPVGDVYFSFHIRSDGSVFVTCKDCSSKELGSATLVPPRGQTSCT